MTLETLASQPQEQTESVPGSLRARVLETDVGGRCVEPKDEGFSYDEAIALGRKAASRHNFALCNETLVILLAINEVYRLAARDVEEARLHRLPRMKPSMPFTFHGDVASHMVVSRGRDLDLIPELGYLHHQRIFAPKIFLGSR